MPHPSHRLKHTKVGACESLETQLLEGLSGGCFGGGGGIGGSEFFVVVVVIGFF